VIAQQRGAGLAPNDGNGGAEGVGVDAAARDHARRCAPGQRPAGAEIDDVRPADAADGHPLLGVAGRGDGGMGELDPERIGRRAGRRQPRNRDAPPGLSRRRIARDEIAAETDQRGRDAERSEHEHRFVGGVALGDAARIDGDGRGVDRHFAARGIEADAGEAAGGARRGDATGLGPDVGVARPTPQVRQAAGGDVEGAAGAPRQGVRGGEHDEQVGAHRHRNAGGRARQRRHLAVVAIVAEAGVDCRDAREGGSRGGLAGPSRLGVEDDADERAHVGRARLDPDQIGRDRPWRGRRRKERRPEGQHRRQPGDRGAGPLHSVTPGIGTAGIGIGPHSRVFGIRLGIASACSQVTTPPWYAASRPRIPASELSAICFSSFSGVPPRMLSIRWVCSVT
jgi:hypothetical protein